MSIDPSALDSYRDFMGEDADTFIAEVIDLFNTSAPSLISTMKEAIIAGEKDTFVRAAHTLKSNSATVGANLLTTLAAELENEGQTNELQTLQKKVFQAEEELEKALKTLASM